MRIYLLLLFISSSTILIATGSTQIDIKDAGVGFMNEGDIALMFFITLENQCRQAFEITASMIQCCENTKQKENDCTSMYLIGGYMGFLYSGRVTNITLIYPNLYLYNRQGVCTVDVKYQNENIVKEITAEIGFKTAEKRCPDSPNCESIDLDPMQNCGPVDCVIKYSGEKSFFNPKCNKCENVPMCLSNPEQCVPDIAYSLATNNCTRLCTAITKDDLQSLETMLDVTSGQGGDNTGSTCDSQSNIICHHGNQGANGQCVCQSDWVTSTDDEVYQPTLLQYHMCNIEVGAWNCVNKGKIRTTALLISIFAITIASKILILMCILSWCYKHFKQQKRVCVQKLDPFDESTILCDTLESFEQCICTEPSKKTGLRSETVNVSYYPCCPSGVSSIRPSTGSVRCKYSTKTNPSIELSNTTSSSIAVSFESDSGSTSNDSDEDAEDNYDIEFVGEGEDEETDEEEGKKCMCEEEECMKMEAGEPSSMDHVEEESEYSVSLAEANRKSSSSSQSRSGTLSNKSNSTRRSSY